MIFGLLNGEFNILVYTSPKTKFLCFRTQNFENYNETMSNDNSTQSDSFIDSLSDYSSKNFFAFVYSLLIGAMFLSTIVRTTSFFLICMKASVNLHNTIFTRILHAPISHFDQNPSGRILNRFSKDVGIVDENLPAVAYELQVVSYSEQNST